MWLRHLKFIFSSFWRLKSLVSMSSHFLETLSLSLSPLSPPLSSVPHYPGVYQVKLVDYQMNIKDFHASTSPGLGFYVCAYLFDCLFWWSWLQMLTVDSHRNSVRCLNPIYRERKTARILWLTDTPTLQQCQRSVMFLFSRGHGGGVEPTIFVTGQDKK